VRFDSRRLERPTRITRRHVFGSGSARLGLSQKGGLPSGERYSLWSKVADARIRSDSARAVDSFSVILRPWGKTRSTQRPARAVAPR
jgi:hypothetical protein